MQFEINNIQKTINHIMRQIGYVSAYFQNGGEFSMVKKIGVNDYPRFHLYIKEHGEGLAFSLHLDQKRPSYPARASHAGGEGWHAHSGDYEGVVVEREAERIKKVLAD